MSSQSDDLTKTAAAAASSATTPDVQALLENGVLERYVLGTLRPEEIDAAKQFFSDPIRARILRNFQTWAEQDPGMIPPDRSQTLTEFWEKISDHVGTQTLRTVRQNKGVFSRQTLRGTGRVVWSTVAAVLVMGLVWIGVHGTRPHREIARTYATHAGQYASVMLANGTKAFLSPNSSLRLMRVDATHQSVAVRGESYFEVPHASAIPFVVQSGGVTAKVLGTAFLVRHADNESHTHIAVASGRVYVSSAAAPRAGKVLSAGWTGDVADSTIRVTSIAPSTAGTEWVNGRLVFHNVSVVTVLETLSHWYGYQFRCTDSTVVRKSVTIGLSMQSSAAAFSVLEDILDVSLTIVGDTVTLTPQTTRPQQPSRTRNYDVWTPKREIGR